MLAKFNDYSTSHHNHNLCKFFRHVTVVLMVHLLNYFGRNFYIRHFEDDVFNSLAGGGYVVSPVNQGKQSVVKHMLAIDWKFWKSYLRTSSARSITIRMLGRVAGSFKC